MSCIKNETVPNVQNFSEFGQLEIGRWRVSFNWGMLVFLTPIQLSSEVSVFNCLIGSIYFILVKEQSQRQLLTSQSIHPESTCTAAK